MLNFCLTCMATYGANNGTPLQYSCLENPRDRGAWWAAVSGVAQSQTRLKRLSSSSSTTYTLEAFAMCTQLCFKKSTKCPVPSLKILPLGLKKIYFPYIYILYFLLVTFRMYKSVLLHLMENYICFCLGVLIYCDILESTGCYLTLFVEWLVL